MMDGYFYEGIYCVSKDSVEIPDDDVSGVTIKMLVILNINRLCYNPSGKIKGKIAILRSIFKEIVGVNIFKKNRLYPLQRYGIRNGG